MACWTKSSESRVVPLQNQPSQLEDSQPTWLGDMPEHWQVQRLRTVAELRVSGIDKKSVEGEQRVRLCNYVDVYRHERIVETLPFMTATATTADVSKYRLMVGDVLITKDSESPDDIGVPALVEYEADDLVSGYHLALLRPEPGTIMGAYLSRVLQMPALRHQFYVRANGVTRFGLSHDAIKSARIPVPPLSEQRRIVAYLDRRDHLIARFIRSKLRLVALLETQREEISDSIIRRGVDPKAPLVESGVPWMGAVPGHWDVIRGKYLFREIDDRTPSGRETLLSLRMRVGLVPHASVSKVPIPAESLVGFKRVAPGQIVMNRMRAATGMFAVAREAGLVSPDYAVFELIHDGSPEYFVSLFKTQAAQDVFRSESKGLGTGQSGFLRLYTDRFGDIKFPVPPRSEQRAIDTRVREATADIEQTLSRVEAEIELVREYRTRLCTDAVMGRIDIEDIPEQASYDHSASLDLGTLAAWDGEAEEDAVEEGEPE